MKKILGFVLALVIIGGIALAEIDLSGMSYDELVELKDQINLAIWNSQEWQEVTVPQGLWVVGEDIPAGKWTIKCASGKKARYTHVVIGNQLNEYGTEISWMSPKYADVYIFNPESLDDGEDDITEYSIELADGDFVSIETKSSKAIFSPFSGKPSLGFK